MTTAIIVYGLMTVIGFAAPIALVAIWKIKTKQPFIPIVLGAIIFFLSAVILESIPKAILFDTGNQLGATVMSNPWIYMTIAALLAGIFEETGRYIAFKCVMKKGMSRRSAISYGIGHGGFEVMYLMVLGGAQYVYYAFMIQSGQFDSIVSQVAAAAPAQAEAIAKIPETLAAVTFMTLVFSVWERIFAVLLHIALSIIVFKSAREKGKVWLFPVAILLHAAVDMVAALYQAGLITNLFIIEGLISVFTAVIFVIAIKYVYKKMPVMYGSEN